MGMYDYINGEQVKCFPWITYVNDGFPGIKLWEHGGNLNGYENGDKVPYRSLAYNYGKYFEILDTEPEFEGEQFLLHVIRDGKVFKTMNYMSEANEVDAALKYFPVFGYRGDSLIWVKSYEDIVRYINAQKEYRNELDELKKESDELRKEWFSVSHGIGLLDKNSDEYKERWEKYTKLYNKIQKQKEKEQPAINKLVEAFRKKWYIEFPADIRKFKAFGEWIMAGYDFLRYEDDKKRQEEFKAYVEDFKRLFKDKIDKKFILDYMEWCEVTVNEKMVIRNYVKEFLGIEV